MSFSIPGHAVRIAAGMVLGCAVVGTAAAQPTTAHPPLSASSAASPTLAQAADAAWLRAAQAREVQGQTRRAQADRTVADSLWPAPPALELSHRNDRWQTSAGRRETEVGLSWPLWLPGQRRAQGAVADADLGLAQAATTAGRLHYAGLVREAAWNVTGQRSEGDLAESQLRYLQDISEDVKRRVAAGDLAPADALAAQSEVLAARSLLLASRQRQGASEAQWKILTGLDAAPDLVQAAEPAEPASFSADTHPEMQMAELNVERLRKRLDLVASNRRDPMELQFRIRQDVPGRGESAQNSIGVGVRVPLGTAARNEPLQAAALSELDVAETAHQRIRDRLTAEAATALAALRSAAQQLETEGQRASLLRERAVLIDRSFKAGETALPELLRALAAAAQADTNLTRQKVALGLAHARLQQAFGILP